MKENKPLFELTPEQEALSLIIYGKIMRFIITPFHC